MVEASKSLNQAKEIASSWDADAGRRETAQTIARVIRRKIPLQKDWKVMDFGAGTGLISHALSPLVKAIWAVDSSPEMIEELQAKQIGNVHTRILDWEKDPFPDRDFQLIVLSMTLHHIKKHFNLLSRFYEVLKPGGWLCIADLYSEPGTFHSDKSGVAHFGFDPNRLSKEMSKVGFENISYSHVYTITSKKIDSSDNTFPVFLLCGRKKS